MHYATRNRSCYSCALDRVASAFPLYLSVCSSDYFFGRYFELKLRSRVPLKPRDSLRPVNCYSLRHAAGKEEDRRLSGIPSSLIPNNNSIEQACPSCAYKCFAALN